MIQFLRRNGPELLQATNEHLALVFIAMTCAIAIGLPLGIVLSRHARWQRPVLGLASTVQTVPSLAMFGFLLPLLGLGAPNALVALVLYSLLPIIRNTVVGIANVDRNVREAAVAMGMTDRQILRQVELPLAASVILSGVRVATVLCVGVTTIASFIAAGGLGQYIQNGLRTNDNIVTLAGAVPAALLALGLDAALGALQTHLEHAAQGETTTATPSRRASRMTFAPLMLLLLLGMAGAVQGARSLFASSSSPSTTSPSDAKKRIVVAWKDFTESHILAEIVAQMAEKRGLNVVRKGALGGSLPHQALLQGQIDLYPEYTGTAWTEILKHAPITDVQAVYAGVKTEYADKFRIEVGPPLGYGNGFAILIRGADARRLKLRTISQIAPYAGQWVAGFGSDFITRRDGFPGFARTYDLHFKGAPRSMDLSLINRALAASRVDLIAGNETDGLIPSLDLFQLRDDKHFFPPYQAVILARQDTLKSAPALKDALRELGGAISTEEMRNLNFAVDGQKRDIADVVRGWLQKKKL